MTRISLIAALTACLLQAASTTAQAPRASGDAALAALLEDLVAANRILARQGILDGFGHVSVRHPDDPESFVISRSLAPELVRREDLVRLDLDGRPVDGDDRLLYRERFIHGEIYKARPNVNAVVHNHSPGIISFGLGEIPLQAVNQNAGFILSGVPTFDYRDLGVEAGVLVHTPARGAALAQTLGDKPAALMRNHGVVVVGTSLPMAVGRSIYLERNAEIQHEAIVRGGTVHYLELEGEVRAEFQNATYERPWELWKRDAMMDME